MIYDNIRNIDNYMGISSNLDNAFYYLKTMDISNLKPGKNEIIGDKLFVMLFDYTTIDPSEAVYEAHKKYVDIQLVLKGHEYIRCFPKNEAEVTQSYDEKGDVELFKISDGLDLLLRPGNFVLYMPEEIHAPKIKTTDSSEITKVVLKILF